jgi:hypothetical protein
MDLLDGFVPFLAAHAYPYRPIHLAGRNDDARQLASGLVEELPDVRRQHACCRRHAGGREFSASEDDRKPEERQPNRECAAMPAC